MTVMNTEETISELCGKQPELYISTGSHCLPPVPMTDPDYLLLTHWPAPRIVTRDRVVLAVCDIPGAEHWYSPWEDEWYNPGEYKWYFPGEWQLSDDRKALCALPLYSHDAAPYLIPLTLWYAVVEKIAVGAGLPITPWSGLIKRRRL